MHEENLYLQPEDEANEEYERLEAGVDQAVLGIPAEDIIWGEDGQPLRIFDRESGRFYDSDSDDEETEVEESSTQETAPQSQYANAADWVLALAGYESRMVELEDGSEVPVSELPIEQRENLIAREFAELHQSYRELEQRAQGVSSAGPGLDAFEQEVIDFLRAKNGDLSSLVEIAEQVHGPDLSKLSDEDIIRRAIAQQHPDLSPEEIEQELDDFKASGSVARKAKMFRKDLAGGENSRTAWAEQRAQARQQQFLQEQREVINRHAQVGSTINEVAGLPLNDQIRQGVLSYALPGKVGEASPLLEQLEDPKKLFEAAFWMQNGPSIVNYFKNEVAQAYQRGKDEMLGKYPPAR